MEEDKKRVSNKNFLDAWINAINGVIYATTTQGNVKKQLLIVVAVIILSLLFELSKIEFVAIIFAIALVVFAEMINTAIETLVDLYVDVYHPKAKIAKDVGAGAVVIAALNSVIVAYFVFFDKIAQIGDTVLESLVKSPIHLAFATVLLTLVAAVALKAANVVRSKKENSIKFVPSGQAMVAFASAMAIWVNTKSMIAYTLAIIMSLLIAVSRYEAKERTAGELVFGGIAGTIIAGLIYSLTLLF